MREQVTIAKTVSFSAAHRLDGLPPGHKCGRVHGHNWLVLVEVTGQLADPAGMVLDYGQLSDAVMVLDHQWLGAGPLYEDTAWQVDALADVQLATLTRIDPLLPFNPTAEAIAVWLRTRIAALGEFTHVRVEVRETDGTRAVHG